MRIRYFEATDTLFIEFRDAPVAETRDLDENTLLDVDANGNICAITIEHASQRAEIPKFSYEQVAAPELTVNPSDATVATSWPKDDNPPANRTGMVSSA